MKKVSICVTIIMMFFTVALIAQQVGPETVNMKEKYAPTGKMKSAIFPHWFHQGFLNCNDCHIEGTALKDQMTGLKLDTGGSPMDVFHNHLCVACHQSKNGPTGCTVCHSGS